MNQVQITSTAAEALKLLPNKQNHYTLPTHTAVVSGQQVANICAQYESLIQQRLTLQRNELLNATGTIERPDLQAKHEKLRNILISYGCEEYGDCIVDEISELFNFPTTNEDE